MGWAEGCVWPFVAPRPGYWQSQGALEEGSLEKEAGRAARDDG